MGRTVPALAWDADSSAKSGGAVSSGRQRGPDSLSGRWKGMEISLVAIWKRKASLVVWQSGTNLYTLSAQNISRIVLRAQLNKEKKKSGVRPNTRVQRFAAQRHPVSRQAGPRSPDDLQVTAWLYYLPQTHLRPGCASTCMHA